MNRESPFEKTLNVPEPPDGTRLVARHGYNVLTAYWRNDKAAEEFKSEPGARWFVTEYGGKWSDALTWEQVLFDATALYMMADEPFAEVEL